MIVFLLALALALPGVAGQPGGKIEDKPRKSKAEPHALLFGTVFDEGGRLVRGAEVQVRAREGKGRWQTRSDERGEFAVRLPAVPAVYIVEARAPGLEPDRQEVQVVSADERTDVALHLKRP